MRPRRPEAVMREKTTASAQQPLRGGGGGQTWPGGSGEERRAALVERLAVIGIVASFASVGLYVLLYFQIGAWQILADVAGVVLSAVFLFWARRLARRREVEAAGYRILLAVLFAYVGPLVFANVTLYATLGVFLLALLVGGAVRPRRWKTWGATFVLYLVCVLLIERFEPLPRYDVNQSEVLRLYIPGITLSLVLLVLWQVARAFRIGTIRTRLLISFVLLVLLPATAIGAGSAVVSLQHGRYRAIGHLESVATLKEAGIRAWIQTLQTQLSVALIGADASRYADILLEEAPDSATYQEAYDELGRHFGRLIERLGMFEELFLMDARGRVVLSSIPARVGQVYSGEVYFEGGLIGSFVSFPSYEGEVSIIIARPVRNREGRTIGVLAGRASMAALNEIMLERAGLGETGETYLIDTDYILLTRSRGGVVGERIHTEGGRAAVGQHVDGAGVYANYRNVPVIGVYRWLPELRVGLLAEQAEAEALRATTTTMLINAGIALAAVGLAVLASLFITQSIASPLAGLAETASRIAGGDLGLVVRVEREDEIGVLAAAFNRMTARLRELIGTLERRVAERTADLERRSLQLEAAAQVAREAAGIRDVG
ncbi:MAG TPA: HAMP domain-containing protein, partial [Anaerolineales bacterium]|nr:HAMP domain-containing protein [Anaerolineales bacterium]